MIFLKVFKFIRWAVVALPIAWRIYKRVRQFLNKNSGTGTKPPRM
jgi:hypothetical protein